ncbi:MAG: hypothetical protein IJ934_00970 [Acetobacter sp.]|nr:hypothetical protein [Acetobacter sp.]
MLHLAMAALAVIVVGTALVWVWCGLVLSINPLFVFYIWMNELIWNKTPEECEILRYSKLRLRSVTVRKLIKRFVRAGGVTQEQADTWDKAIDEAMSPYGSYVKGQLSFADFVKIKKVFSDIELQIGGGKRS